MPQLAGSGGKLIMVLSSGFSRNTHEFLFTCLCDTVTFRSASSSGSRLQGLKPQCVGVTTHLYFDLLLQMLISCVSYCFFFPTKYIWALCLLHTRAGKKRSLIYEANETDISPCWNAGGRSGFCFEALSC